MSAPANCSNCGEPISHAEARDRSHKCAPDSEAMAKLPEVCYTTLNSDPRQVVALKRGETGYWPLNEPRNDAAEIVAMLNKGIKPEQVAAMENGSLFGWHVLGANPDKCRADMDRLPKMAASYNAKVSA